MIIKLGDNSHNFLQVLIPEIILERINNGINMKLKISDDLDSIRTSEERKKISDIFSDENLKKEFREKLDYFRQNRDILSYRIDCEKFKFRYANGGVLPILRIKDTDYFVLFYRCIFPIGWNIANGASNDLEDLFFPDRIVLREFAEELIFFDKENKILYDLDHDDNSINTGTRREAIQAWNVEEKDINFDKYTVHPLPIKWINGIDSYLISRNNISYSNQGFFVNITPDDNAIEVDKIAFIHFNNEISILDGEILNGLPEEKPEERLLNRIIGLFEVGKLLPEYNKGSRYFKPDRIFYSGKERKSGEMDQVIREYFDRHNHFESRGKKWAKEFDPMPEENRFNLCPITRELLNKYSRWNEIQTEIDKQAEITTPSKGFQLFISYKSEDEDIAIRLYDKFDSMGIRAFCSTKSLPSLGESEYGRQIMQALEQASVLVVVATKSEFLDTEWVRFEWNSFRNEIWSKRKKGNPMVFTFTNNIAIAEMPYGLRDVTNIPFDRNAAYPAIEHLVSFIEKSFPPDK
jgi:hypothetical protein